MQHLIATLLGASADHSHFNQETQDYITGLMNRAHQNLHGKGLSTATAAWANTMIAAGLQLYKDARVHALSSREIVQLFENVIRISEEHQKTAKRHASMATNVFYLKETALDGAFTPALTSEKPAFSTVQGTSSHHTGRIHHTPLPAAQDS